MRHERRHIDEIAGFGFGDKFELIAPAHAGPPADDVDDAFQFAVVVGAGFGIGLDLDGAGPEFIGAGFGVVDGGGAGHARGLLRVVVELVAAYDAHAIFAPVVGLAHGSGSLFAPIVA